MTPEQQAKAREAAEKHKDEISSALQTDYHRGKHAESYLAGYAQGFEDGVRACLEKWKSECTTCEFANWLHAQEKKETSK